MARKVNVEKGKQGFQRTTGTPNIPATVATQIPQRPTLAPPSPPSCSPLPTTSRRAQTFTSPGARAQLRCAWCEQMFPIREYESHHPTCAKTHLTEARREQNRGKLIRALKSGAMLVGASVATAGSALLISPLIPAAVAVGTIGMLILYVRGSNKPLETISVGQLASDARKRREDTPNFAIAEKETHALAAQLGVRGRIYPMLVSGGTGASVLRRNDDESTIHFTPHLLDLPPRERQAILAHEVAHLQKTTKQQGYVSALHSSGTIVATGSAAAAAAAGAAFPPIAAIAGGVWIANRLATRAVSRAEERRADRTAYELHGETFTTALEKMVLEERTDLPGRLEDAFSTHGSTKNRINDLRNE